MLCMQDTLLNEDPETQLGETVQLAQKSDELRTSQRHLVSGCLPCQVHSFNLPCMLFLIPNISKCTAKVVKVPEPHKHMQDCSDAGVDTCMHPPQTTLGKFVSKHASNTVCTVHLRVQVCMLLSHLSTAPKNASACIA